MRRGSDTETFAALRLWVDNWRWMDVPFYIRAGKNLPVTCTELLVRLKRTPSVYSAHAPAANHVRMRISPDVTLAIGMNVLSPDDERVSQPVEMLAMSGWTPARTRSSIRTLRARFPRSCAYSWFARSTMWIQNEDTAHLPDKVDRRTFQQLLASGTPRALSPEESLRAMRARPGFKVELVAAEPLIRDPIAFDWSADGRLWVLEMSDYPLGVDGKGSPGGRVRQPSFSLTVASIRSAKLLSVGMAFLTK